MGPSAASVLVRTTGSHLAGMGHLARCLALANELVALGWRCVFWVEGDERGCSRVAQAGFDVVNAPPGGTFGAMVVDDYGVDATQVARWHRVGTCLVVIDDLADRELDCDVVINSTACAAGLHYRVPSSCRVLAGPSYALLRPSFRGVPPRAVVDVRRVLVTLGGSDPQGLTPMLVDTLRKRTAIDVDVVLGLLYAGPTPAAGPRVRVHRDLPDLAPLMHEADVAVTSGGQTTYELAASGLPAVALAVAENQRGTLDALAAIPTLVDAREPGRVVPAVEALAANAPLRLRMSRAGQALVDGLGAVRVAQAITEFAASGRAHA